MPDKPDCRSDLDQVRHIEGFPLGTDEDICALSDPPYYTAYPNPHIADFIAKYGTTYDETTDNYHREPFVGDVSEGKTESIYMAHTYHTKVPPAAITQFINHYCNPKDIVLDVFCGTGMTGVAASRAENHSILLDLSPIATNIARTQNSIFLTNDNLFKAEKIINEVSTQVNWMYETTIRGQTVPSIWNYMLWSDVFSCPYCKTEDLYINFSYLLPDFTSKVPRECPHCQANLQKTDMLAVLDKDGKIIQKPFLVQYKVGAKGFLKEPNDSDLALVQKIAQTEIPAWYPNVRMLFRQPPWGDMYRAGYHTGYEYVEDFFTKRSLYVLAVLWEKASKSPSEVQLLLRYAITSVLTKTGSKMHNVGIREQKVNLAGQIPNTLQPTSIHAERNLPDLILKKLKSFRKLAKQKKNTRTIISTQSATDLANIPDESIDYVFIDPPFGGNIIYSEMNFIWEAWLKVFTNNNPEAICSKAQNKGLDDYRLLMIKTFEQLYKKLKPTRWITVEFHNSSASVWNAIQDSLTRVGFIVAQVAVLDKGQGTYKQQTAPGTVENDLVINAYKPRQNFVDQFLQKAGAGMERAFIKQHLGYLPIAANVERTREMLYSKMLAYYIQRGYEISLNSAQFYRLLAAEFVERDGYWFGDEAQAQEYEQRKLDPARRKAAGKGQGVLFITDERSAIAWLHHFLAAGPRTYSDIYTAYTKALQTSDDQIPEPKQLLEETCVQVNGHWKRPDALTAEELENRRRERLLRQFNDYLREAAAGQKLKDVRKEAILAGFEEAYRAKRFGDIVTVGHKLNRSLVDSSTEIFDFMDIAEAKLV